MLKISVEFSSSSERHLLSKVAPTLSLLCSDICQERRRKKIKFFREHLKRVLEKQSSALATLLFVDWLPQVNGPPKSPVSLKS